ncbi:ladderlectin-like [Thalassophryne amazonica]|uniref:ladderlectin-like n=1 Tax=Thalassophryne amazonica TaxID=390379 RepID=UPI001470E8EF|nr:ladderlectin-like [Thalassophryne amazonica]
MTICADPKPAAVKQVPSCKALSPRCRQGWHSYEDNCFHLVNLSYAWNNAAFYCENLSSTLASVHSQKEYSFLQQLTWKAGFLTAWIAGYRFQSHWRWADGTVFDYNNWDGSNSYYYECLYLNSDGNKGWSSQQQCELLRPFICSYKPICC